MAETTLIATFYSFKPFVKAAHTFSPSRIFLLVAEESMKHEDVKNGILEVKRRYGDLSKVEIVPVPGTDLLAIAKKTAELLKAWSKEGRVIVNISGGWKLLAQGVLYGCYAYPSKVERIVCNSLEDERLVEIPRLRFDLKPAKRRLLSEISKRDGKSIAELAKKLGNTPGMLYQHLKDLREMGYVDEKFEITVAGRLALI